MVLVRQTMYRLCLFIALIWCVCSRDASEWRSRSIYQLLTDRFAVKNGSSLRCTEHPMSNFSLLHYCGGTYRGAIDQLDYIAGMGFNALRISPIPSNVDNETHDGVGWHGYWQDNLYQLNRQFGTEQDLIEFIDAANRRDIWVMLDVVANHVGPNVTGHYTPFNQPEHYHEPCVIKNFDDQHEVEYCSLGGENNSLPDLNTENPYVVSTLLSWINQTVSRYKFDGIRMDAFRHVRQSFWLDYTRAANVYSIGEVSRNETDTAYVGRYTHYADGVLHYPLFHVLNRTFRDDETERRSMFFLEKQVKENQQYFKDTTLCGTFLDKHDTERFLSHTQDPMRVQNALVYLMFSDEIPIVFQGTEQNFRGDPNLRSAETDLWNRAPLWRSNYDRSNWIYRYLSQLNRIRSSIEKTFFSSIQQTVYVDNETYAYIKGIVIVVVSNQPFNGTKLIRISPLSNSNRFKDQLSEEIKQTDRNNQLEIKSWSPMVLIPLSSSSSISSLSLSFILVLYILINIV